MSVNLTKPSKKSRLPVSSLLPRIAIYSMVLTGIIASFVDFKSNPFSFASDRKFPEPKQYISRIIRGQQAYYAEQGQFSNDIVKLDLGIKEHGDNYNYTIVSSMGPVQTLPNQREPAQFESAIVIARPESSSGKSYTGAVFAFKKESSINQLITISVICKSEGDRVTLIPPTLDGKKIHCPPGTTILR